MANQATVKPFESLFQYIKQNDPKAFEIFKKIQNYLVQLYSLVITNSNDHITALSFTGIAGLTTDWQTIPDLEVPVNKPGWWKATAFINLLVDHNDTFINISASFDGSDPELDVIQLAGAGTINIQYHVSKSWEFQSVTGSEVIRVQVKRISGTGTSIVPVSVAVTRNYGGKLLLEWMHS